MIDVLRGLEHAHCRGIVHRDIKPANILIGNNLEGKLSDFGLALPNFATLNLALIKQQYQYWMHLAPEVNSFTDYTQFSDIYACGITLYRLINGDSFIPRLDFNEMRRRIKDGTFPDRTRYRDFIPRPMKMLINKALALNPDDRYKSAQEMRHVLEQVATNVSWNEKKVLNGVVWQSSTKGFRYRICLFHDSRNRWFIEGKKGKARHSLRKVSAWCHDNLSRPKAEQVIKRLLQDLVLGKIK
jgi:serine/threonine protein kinase